MSIRFDIRLDGVLFSRTVDWTAVPRVGDHVHLCDGGWSEEVYRVWWELDGSAYVEFRESHDTHGEELADALVRAGWLRS